MMRSPDEVLALYTERLRYYTPVHAAMRAISDIYEGTATINLPDMDREETPSVPNLLAQGVDQMAGRVASVTPMVSFASDNPGQRLADRRAQTARRTVQGWWQVDRMRLKQKQRARHILAYAWGPTTLRFDAKLHRPTWEVRNPLETFPNPETINGSFLPMDTIFAYRRTIGWLVTHGYLGQVMALLGPSGIRDAKRDADMLMLEYVDSDGRMLLLTGLPGSHNFDLPWSTRPDGKTGAVLCDYSDTRGVMTASVPTRIALNRPSGQFDGMVGMYYTQAKLMALEVIAVEKGIFPDTYLEGRPGETPRIIDGPHDGRSGAINVVIGGSIREIQTTPGYMTNQTIDRIERGQRLTSGIPQEFGGESTSNIRTGRRGDAVLSAVIDFPVGDIQDIFAYALVDEDKAAIALAKQFDGSASRTIWVGQGAEARKVTYVANEVFTHDEHTVTYPVSGADQNALMVGLGQRVGLGTLSKESSAYLDPFVESPELEHDRIVKEGLEAALMSGIQQKAATGELPPLVMAKLMMLVANDKMELAEAMDKVTKDAMAAAQEQQAAAPPGQPGQAQTPEQQMAPAAAQGMTGSAIPGANPTQTSLADLISRIRRPQAAQQQMAQTPAGAA
jgi:hypothetical protein